MNAAAVVVLIFLGFPALVAIYSIWRGYVFSIIWGWFAVPGFGLPPISIPMAIGISLLVSFLTMHKTGNEAERTGDVGDKVGRAFTMLAVAPALTLLMGWIVQKFL